MAYRLKLTLFWLMLWGIGIFSIYNIAYAIRFGEVRYRSGWITSSEAPVAFVIALGVYSCAALMSSGMLIYAPFARRAERIALQRWKNSPRFDDPEHDGRISHRKIDDAR